MLPSQDGEALRVKKAKKVRSVQATTRDRSRATRRPSRNGAQASHDRAQPFRLQPWLKIAIVAGLFAGLALSPKLWLSDRLYPLTPVLRFLTPIPAPFDAIFYAALLATLAAIAILARPAKLIGAFAVLAIVTALFDQSRWQPWFYQYLVMLIAVGWYYLDRDSHDDDHHPALNVCRLVVVCTYIWSGLQKANTDFMVRNFPFLVEPFTRSLPPPLVTVVNSFGILAPFIEIAVGIGLLTRRFRRYAIFGGIGMHTFILLAIGPLGLSYNDVVWPWNLVMISLLLILFWNRPNLSAREILWPRGAVLHRLALLLFGIAPALSFFNIWDSDLSSALYADIRNVPIIFVTDALAGRLPKEIQRSVYPTKQPGTKALNVWEWSTNELNVTIYPEPRIYKNVARYICSYAHDPSEVKLLIRRQRVLFAADKQVLYDCRGLSK